MRPLFAICLALLIAAISTESWARREALTPEQKSKMDTIRTVLIDVIAISDKGPMDPTSLRDVVASRLREFGYVVTTDAGQAHDVVFRVEMRTTQDLGRDHQYGK